ncbi:hypothetical protein D3C75_956970 [compost metagenome]
MHHGHAVLHRLHALLHGGVSLGRGRGCGCLVVCSLHFLHLLGHDIVLLRRSCFARLARRGLPLLRVMLVDCRGDEWAADQQGGEDYFQ